MLTLSVAILFWSGLQCILGTQGMEIFSLFSVPLGKKKKKYVVGICNKSSQKGRKNKRKLRKSSTCKKNNKESREREKDRTLWIERDIRNSSPQ